MRFTKLFDHLPGILIMVALSSPNSNIQAINSINNVYSFQQSNVQSNDILATLGDGNPHEVDFQAYSQCTGRFTFHSTTDDEIPCNLIKAKQGSYSSDCMVLSVGDKENPFYSMDFSPIENMEADLETLKYSMVFEPFDKSISSVKLSEILYVPYFGDIVVGDGSKLAWDPKSTETYPIIHEYSNLLSSIYYTELSDIKLSIVNTDKVPGRLLIYKIDMYANIDLKDPGIDLSEISNDIQWNAEKFNLKDTTNPIFSGPKVSEIVATLTPKFTTISTPNDASDEYLNSINGKDAYYHTPASVKINSKNSISFTIPCSGLYSLSLQVKSSATTYSHKIYQKDINIYPNTDILNVNWRTVDNPKNFMIPWITANHNWTNAHFDLPNTYGYDTYYSVIGTPYEDDPTFGGVVTPAEKVVDPEDYRVAKIRKADSDLTTIHSVPDNYSKYGASGIDLTKGKQVSLYFTKNGAVTPEYNLTYVVPDDTVTDVEIFAQDTPEEYFTLQGIPVDASHLSPGIYICKSANQSRKVVVK